MNEAFIYYRFYEIGQKIDNVRKEIVGKLEVILKELDALLSDAKKEGVDPLHINNMITTYFEIQRVKDSVDRAMNYYSTLIVDSMRNALYRLLLGKMCSFDDYERDG